jgi:hypothetical protein
MGCYVYTEKDVIDAIFDITEGSLSQYQSVINVTLRVPGFGLYM